jgi:hypothetical protein
MNTTVRSAAIVLETQWFFQGLASASSGKVAQEDRALKSAGLSSEAEWLDRVILDLEWIHVMVFSCCGSTNET